MGRYRYKILRGPVIAGLVLLSAVACKDGSDGNEAALTPALTVQVAQAERRDVQLSIDMVGSTLGTQDVPIRARVEGFLESMDFDEGTFVTKGDLLYTIDPQPFQAKLVEAQSQLAAAQTQLIKAEADLARIRPLAEMNAVSQQDLDSAIASEAAANATVKANEAAVELAQINLSYTRIHAPIDGLIGITQARPGEFVGRDPNPVVLNVLSDIDPIRVRFSISEREYLILARTYMAVGKDETRIRHKRSNRERDLVLVLADNSVHDEKGGVVAASQSIDPETGTYTIEAAFPNPDKFLLPGQFARVRSVYQVLEDVVVIPRQAISELQGLYRVYLVDDSGTVSVRDVTLGPASGDDVVIETGIEAGDTVIVEGLQKVRPGATVRPVPFGSASPQAPAGTSSNG
jgi:membrane fusion protein (multidrug efflux system)